MNNETMAERIRFARENKKLTPEEAAAKCGVSAEMYLDWETGKSEPDTETARRLADILGITSDMLLFGIVNRSGIQTMFPKSAAPEKVSMSDWQFILGIVLIFLGVACLAIMLVSVQVNSYYDTFGSLLAYCAKSPSLYVFGAMIVGGIVLCIVRGVGKLRAAARRNRQDKD